MTSAEPTPNKRILHFALAAMLLLLGLAIRLYHIDYPFIATQDSGMFPSFARNLAELGPGKTGFLPIRAYLADGSYTHHTHHPPATHLALAGLFKLFGPREWVYRLFNIVSGGLLGGLFLYLLAADKIGRSAALWALFFWAFIPSSAYFERMYTMNMQAQSLILAFLFFFWRFGERGGLRWGAPMVLCILLGALTDWHFHFIFPGLFLLCLLGGGSPRLCIISGLISAGVAIAYAGYAALIKTDTAGYYRAAVKAGGWAGYAENKLNPLEIFNPKYLQRIGRLFSLHFTVLGWLVPIGWSAALVLRRLKKQGVFWPLALPLLLLSPGVIYIVTVPHNTYGHIWTLYWLMPPMAAAFGVLMNQLWTLGQGWLRIPSRAIAVCFTALLIVMAAPTLARLYRPSAYHVGAARAGQVTARFADRSRLALVENYDTLAFYSGMAMFDIPFDRQKFLRSIEGKAAGAGKPPSLIAFNQEYRSFAKPGENLSSMDVALAHFGYHRWLYRPAAVWSLGDTSRLFLFMDQYAPPARSESRSILAGQAVYFVDGSRLLRGLEQKLKPGGDSSVFLGVPLPDDKRYFTASVFLGKLPAKAKGIEVSYRVDVSDSSGAATIARGVLTPASPARRITAPLGAWSGRKADFRLSCALKKAGAPANGIRLFWGEPRLVKSGFTPRQSLWVPRGVDFFSENQTGGGDKPVSLAAAAYFWLNCVKSFGNTIAP